MQDSLKPSLNGPIIPTSYWHDLGQGRVQCDVCPRNCQLQEGQRGLCFVRMNQNQKIVLTTYGRSSGFCVDPIEKKPLNHFYPGTPVLSFGTAGCNLTCQFCQNWDISKSREVETLSSVASPELIAQKASELNCTSVAFTYNDPVIFMEYAIDTARACHEKNIKSVAVTAGYMSAEPRKEFYQYMDAANVDLKGFTERFYKKLCSAELSAILETLEFIKHETKTWLEITTLLIPGENDSPHEIEDMSRWIYDHLGPDVPLHFTAFHPDFKMNDISPTPTSTLTRSREIALSNGLHYVYTGNVHDEAGGSTYCPGCKAKVIGRDWYTLKSWALDSQGHCLKCRTKIAGHFDSTPGQWGPRRLPVQMVEKK